MNKYIILLAALLLSISSCKEEPAEEVDVEPKDRTFDSYPRGEKPNSLQDYSQWGYKWDRCDLKYFITYSDALSKSQERAIYKDAFDQWEQRTVLSFTEVSSKNEADIVLGGHGRIDGPSGTLAHACHPCDGSGDCDVLPCGTMEFDNEEDWSLGNRTGGIDLLTVTLHEIGHVLGLNHSSVEESMMYASYDGPKSLHSDDIQGINNLYAATCKREQNATIRLTGDLNFGSVKVGNSAERTFTISNVGEGLLKVSGFEVPQGFSIPVFQTQNILGGESYAVTVRFSPSREQYYNGVIKVLHDGTGGNEYIALSGQGEQEVALESDLYVYDLYVVKESDEEIRIRAEIGNQGNATTPDNEVVDIEYYINGQYVGDDHFTELKPGDLAFESTLEKDILGNANNSIQVAIISPSNESRVSNNMKTINYYHDVSGGSAGTTVVPTNSCSNGTSLELNKTYTVSNLNTGNFSKFIPIDGHSQGGADIRGFWFSVQTPSASNSKYRVVISNVSSNFDPVVGVKGNCNLSNYLGNVNQNLDLVANQNGKGGNERYVTYLPQDRYGIRMYHYNGSESPTVSFKIRVELD